MGAPSNSFLGNFLIVLKADDGIEFRLPFPSGNNGFLLVLLWCGRFVLFKAAKSRWRTWAWWSLQSASLSVLFIRFLVRTVAILLTLMFLLISSILLIELLVAISCLSSFCSWKKCWLLIRFFDYFKGVTVFHEVFVFYMLFFLGTCFFPVLFFLLFLSEFFSNRFFKVVPNCAVQSWYWTHHSSGVFFIVIIFYFLLKCGIEY